jgi:hypothetical protein
MRQTYRSEEYVMIGLMALTSPLWGPLYLLGRVAAFACRL